MRAVKVFSSSTYQNPATSTPKPSVTGLVFSYDEGATRYAAITKIQQPRPQNHR